jgi:16S rRNA processing protein RimM
LDEIASGFVAVARVLGARGTSGALNVQSLAPPTVLVRGRAVWTDGRQYEVQDVKRGGRFLHVKLAGIEDRETAARLRDRFLQIPETGLDPLPPGQYYRFQLLGLMVRSSDGQDLGPITDILTAPENDVYVVRGAYGEVLIPAVDDVVLSVDLDARVVTVEIVPGLLP